MAFEEHSAACAHGDAAGWSTTSPVLQVLAHLLERSGYDPECLHLDDDTEQLVALRRSLRLRGCADWRAVKPAGEAAATEGLVADVLRALERGAPVGVAVALHHLADRSGEPSLTAALTLDAVAPETVVALLAALEDETCR